ncbi:hypothetical protein ACSBR1_012153 [Camellia fascicularis]
MMKQSIPNKKKKNSIPKELPCQIILEILSRLPFKTLFLCQLVSKHWLSLILDPHFVNLHLSRSPVSLLLKPSTATADRTNSTWLTSKPSIKSVPAKPN